MVSRKGVRTLFSSLFFVYGSPGQSAVKTAASPASAPCSPGTKPPTGSDCWRGWGRSIPSSARTAAATSGPLTEWAELVQTEAHESLGSRKTVAEVPLTGLSFAGHARTQVYRSLLAVWADTVAKSPSNQRALLWFGVALLDAGRPVEAFEMFGRTIDVDRENRQCAKAHAFRAAALGSRGDFEACVREAARAVELEPRESIEQKEAAVGE